MEPSPSEEDVITIFKKSGKKPRTAVELAKFDADKKEVEKAKQKKAARKPKTSPMEFIAQGEAHKAAAAKSKADGLKETAQIEYETAKLALEVKKLEMEERKAERELEHSFKMEILQLKKAKYEHEIKRK